MKFALRLPRFVCVSGCVCVCGWMSACKRQCVPVWACAEFPCELQLCRNLSALSPRDAILGKNHLKKRQKELKSKSQLCRHRLVWVALDFLSLGFQMPYLLPIK